MAKDASIVYMPQLDGLRALAVSMVCWCHFVAWPRWLPAGGIGVQLFFVLSGFLITGILLRVRSDIEKGRTTAAYGLRQFYVRRVLRIFPVYYLSLVIACAAFPGVRQVWPWHFSYTSNLLRTLGGNIGDDVTIPFWSLCVEEHFYLIWPWIVLFLPVRAIPGALGFLFLLGPISRCALFFSDRDWNVFTTASFDTLSAGAILAWCTSPFAGRRSTATLQRLGLLASGASIAVMLLGATIPLTGSQTVYFVGRNTCFAFAFCWVVHRAAFRFRGRVGAALQSRPLTYVGRISYGIYVYHLFARAGLDAIAGSWLRSIGPGRQVLYFATAIGVASLSWRFYERPINRLKARFAYRRPVAAGGDGLVLDAE